jgi:5-hydroxyisourate hydrolase-like protein (transthyretin family)
VPFLGVGRSGHSALAGLYIVTAARFPATDVHPLSPASRGYFLSAGPFRGRGTSRVRVVLSVLTAFVIGGLLAAGAAVPAFAAGTHSLTVKVNSSSGAPFLGLTIIAVPVLDGHTIAGDAAADGSWPLATAVSGHPGSYLFASLGDFDHTLYFETASKTEFSQLLGGVSDIDRAEVLPASQTTLSTSLATNAVITGTLKTATGAVAAGATVESYYFDGGQWEEYSYATTDSRGRYSLTDIDPGSYKLEFVSRGQTRPPLFSGGTTTLDAATAVNVEVATSTIANGVFPSFTGSISGRSTFMYNGEATFYLSDATPVAYPVTQAEWGTVEGVDYGRAVRGKPSTSHGAWSIAGLAPGDYVVQMQPRYYNQASQYLGSGTDGAELAQARVVHVGSKNVSAGLSSFYAGVQGGSVTISLTDTMAIPVSGAHVLLQRNSDSNEYYEGTTNSSGVVSLGKSGKYSIIQPGEFTVSVVMPDQSHEPLRSQLFVDSVANKVDYELWPVSSRPGFQQPPFISETSTVVGTSYTVSAYSITGREGDVSYQWLRNGHPIFGATTPTYRSRSSDLGTQLSARVSNSSFGFESPTSRSRLLESFRQRTSFLCSCRRPRSRRIRWYTPERSFVRVLVVGASTD